MLFSIILLQTNFQTICGTKNCGKTKFYIDTISSTDLFPHFSKGLKFYPDVGEGRVTVNCEKTQLFLNTL